MKSVATDVLEGKSSRWLLDVAADAMLVVDSQGRIVLANPAAERLFGYDLDELARLTVEDLMPQRLRAMHQAQRAENGGRSRSRAMGSGLAIRGLRKNGSEFDADVSLSPIEDGLVLATVYDTTRRKRAEESLAAAREFAESIVSTIQESLVVLDADLRVISANPAFHHVFQITPEGTLGQFFFQLHDRRWESKELRDLLSRPVSEQRTDASFELQHEFGARTLRLNARAIPGKTGERTRILLAIEDITDRTRLEAEQTRLIHELESANEELKNFAYVVSHDLKAPLRAIGSLADWIAADQKERLDAEGREHLRLLIQRVKRMDALIDGVLRYSRIGLMHEALVAVELDPLIREVIDSLAPPAQVEVTVAQTLPTIRTERTRIQQVFQNLLANAIRFMDKPQGRIRIDCEAEGEMWKFSVADNGPGIEPRHFERIFQLFQTLNPRDRVESTGVGLAIVKKIVELYGGRIWVVSAPGRGSTFFFTLPRTAPQAPVEA